jgi:hypothetical protein
VKNISHLPGDCFRAVNFSLTVGPSPKFTGFREPGAKSSLWNRQENYLAHSHFTLDWRRDDVRILDVCRPGRNYAAATDPAFPVDVLLNDEVCSVHGLPFGIQGPLTFEPGTYNVKVSIANTLAPCTNAPLIDRAVAIEPRTDISAAIALTKDGLPTLLTFTNTLSPVAANTDRVLFALAANSPELQVILQNAETSKLYTYAVKPGTLLDANLPAGNYNVEINQGATTLVASTPLRLNAQSVTLL